MDSIVSLVSHFHSYSKVQEKWLGLTTVFSNRNHYASAVWQKVLLVKVWELSVYWTEKQDSCEQESEK